MSTAAIVSLVLLIGLAAIVAAGVAAYMLVQGDKR